MAQRGATGESRQRSLGVSGTPGESRGAGGVCGSPRTARALGTIWESRGVSGGIWESLRVQKVWESLGIGDQRSDQCMEETLVYGPESPVDTSRVPVLRL